MPEESETTVVEALRSLVQILSGTCHFLLALVSRQPAEHGEQDDEAPEEGLALLGSSLRCIAIDRIVPAIAELEILIAEWAPKTAREPES